MATTDWKSPSAHTAVNTVQTWSSPANIYAEDAATASLSMAEGTESGRLWLRGFGFTTDDVPSTATIDGIEIRHVGRVSAGSYSLVIGAAYNNVMRGASKATSRSNTANAELVLGGATDKWGAGITATEVVNPLFGCFVAVGSAGASFLTYHDVAQIRVHYTDTGPDVTPPVITSNPNPVAVDGVSLSHALTADEAVTWTKVGGADAAAFTLSDSTLSLPAQTYPAGPYEVVVRATDPSGNWNEQTITVSVVEAPPLLFIGSATGTTTATMPAHQPGDVILCWAYRDGSNTLPTLPSEGWTALNRVTGSNTNSAQLLGKIATTSSEAVGTHTSATSVIVMVYRPRADYVPTFGAVAAATGLSTNINYPALSLENTDGTSWVVGFAGHRSLNTALETPPLGMINRVTLLDATDEVAAHDTNGGVPSWSSTTVNAGGGSSGWRAATVEIKVALAVTARPTFQAFIIG